MSEPRLCPRCQNNWISGDEKCDCPTPVEHIASKNCWCHPTESYRDPVSGRAVYVHHKPNRFLPE
jgi:hypothetical protein